MLFGKSDKFSTLKGSVLNTQINRSRFLFHNNDVADRIEDARNIGKLSKSSSYTNRGDVGGRNDRDYYTFKVKKAGTIKLKIDHIDRDDPITVSIVNRQERVLSVNGKRLITEIDPREKGKLSARLQKGTYYLKIESEDGRNQDYRLSLKFNTQKDNDDRDDD
jgi:hypothetical protein